VGGKKKKKKKGEGKDDNLRRLMRSLAVHVALLAHINTANKKLRNLSREKKKKEGGGEGRREQEGWVRPHQGEVRFKEESALTRRFCQHPHCSESGANSGEKKKKRERKKRGKERKTRPKRAREFAPASLPPGCWQSPFLSFVFLRREKGEEKGGGRGGGPQEMRAVK